MASFGYLLPTRGSVLDSDTPGELTARTQADILGLARRAESIGFGSVWVGDSVFARPRHEPLSTLAAVAGMTESVDLGTAIYLPTLRNPIHVAHQTATLQYLSGGRLSLGVGVGHGEVARHEANQLDRPFDKRGAMMDETLAVLEDLWHGETLTHEGEFYQFEDVDLGFRPAEPPRIHIASSFDPERGFPRRIRERIAKHGDGWFPTSITPSQFEAGFKSARDIVEEAGRMPETLDSAYYLNVAVSDSEAAALEKAQAFMSDYYPDWDSSDDHLRRIGAFGTTEQVRERIESFVDAGVETFVTRFPTSNQREQFRRFSAILSG